MPYYKQELNTLEQMRNAAKNSIAEVIRLYKGQAWNSPINCTTEGDHFHINYRQDNITYTLTCPLLLLLKKGDAHVPIPFQLGESLGFIEDHAQELQQELHIVGHHVAGIVKEHRLSKDPNQHHEVKRIYYPKRGLFLYSDECDSVIVESKNYFTEQRTFIELDRLCHRARYYPKHNYVEELWVNPKTKEEILLSTETINLPEEIPRTFNWNIETVSKEFVGTFGIPNDKMGIDLWYLHNTTPVIGCKDGKMMPIAFYRDRLNFVIDLTRTNLDINQAKQEGEKLDNLLLDLS